MIMLDGMHNMCLCVMGARDVAERTGPGSWMMEMNHDHERKLNGVEWRRDWPASRTQSYVVGAQGCARIEAVKKKGDCAASYRRLLVFWG